MKIVTLWALLSSILGRELLDQASVNPAGLACLGFDFVPRLSFIGHLELVAPLHRCDYFRTGGGRFSNIDS